MCSLQNLLLNDDEMSYSVIETLSFQKLSWTHDVIMVKVSESLPLVYH